MHLRRSDRVRTCVGSMTYRDERAGGRLLVVPGQRVLVAEKQDVEDGLADRTHAAEELETAGAAQVGESEVLQVSRVGEGEREGPDGYVWGLGAVEAEEGERGSVAENAVDGVLEIVAPVEVVTCCARRDGLVEDLRWRMWVCGPSASAMTCATALRCSFPESRLYLTWMKSSAIPPKARKRYSLLPPEGRRPSMIDSGVFLIVKRNPATMRPKSCSN